MIARFLGGASALFGIICLAVSAFGVFAFIEVIFFDDAHRSLGEYLFFPGIIVLGVAAFLIGIDLARKAFSGRKSTRLNKYAAIVFLLCTPVSLPLIWSGLIVFFLGAAFFFLLAAFGMRHDTPINSGFSRV